MRTSEQIVSRLHAHVDVTPPDASLYQRNRRGPLIGLLIFCCMPMLLMGKRDSHSSDKDRKIGK